MVTPIRRPARCALALLGALGLGAAPPGDPAGAGAGTALPAPTADAWEALHFRSIERHTRYLASPDAGPDVLRAVAECAASARVLPLDDVDLARTPVLRWRWRVLRPLEVEDERSRGGDDFAARVYVMFRFEPERASLLERARRRLGQTLFGTTLPGTALSFVWTGAIEPGEIWTNPHAAESKMVAIARGAFRSWRDASVDVPRTYRRAFGRPAPAALGLGIMTDADDTCQRAVAEYADFRFVAADARQGTDTG